jgi:hypothetical protein
VVVFTGDVGAKSMEVFIPEKGESGAVRRWRTRQHDAIPIYCGRFIKAMPPGIVLFRIFLLVHGGGEAHLQAVRTLLDDPR